MRLISSLIWTLLVFYSIYVINQEGLINDPLLNDLIQFNKVNPLILTIFLLMGIWPIIYLLLLMPNNNRKYNAMWFVITSFLIGVFAILPYFFLNNETTIDRKTPTVINKLIKTPIVVLGLSILIMIIAGYGVLFGSYNQYISVFKQSSFLNIMTLDFITLYLVSILYLYDLKEDDHKNEHLYALVPLIGPLIYLYKDKSLIK